VKARKRFGQHFLEPAWTRKLIDVIQPQPGQSFLEIGPGYGALTRRLAAAGARVLAVEIDRDLAAALRSADLPEVRVVEGDVLSLDLAELLHEFAPGDRPPAAGDPPVGSRMQVRVAGNLPYNISSPILFRLLDLYRSHALPADATLMLQREVVDRLVARPGSREYGVLSVLVPLHAEVTRRLVLPPGAFRPMPRVTSAVVQLTFRPPPVAVGDPGVFEELVRAIFTQRRKTILNALKPFAARHERTAGDLLSAAGIAPGRRPETLSTPELAQLARAVPAGHPRAVL
jgi:16S rRNA (adenine1518-N6/adenine1519-N6)-dimethyltransferase